MDVDALGIVAIAAVRYFIPLHSYVVHDLQALLTE